MIQTNTTLSPRYAQGVTDVIERLNPDHSKLSRQYEGLLKRYDKMVDLGWTDEADFTRSNILRVLAKAGASADLIAVQEDALDTVKEMREAGEDTGSWTKECNLYEGNLVIA